MQALRVVSEVPDNKDVAILTPVARGTRVQCTVTRFRGLRMKFIVEQQLPNGGKVCLSNTAPDLDFWRVTRCVLVFLLLLLSCLCP